MDVKELNTGSMDDVMEKYAYVYLYDSASRPVVTGICDEPTGEVPRMRAAFGSSGPGLDSTYYSTGVPLTGAEVHTATYYDNYDFVSLPPFAPIPAVQMPTATAAAGLVTATLDRVLEGTLDPRRAKYVATVNTYDAEERPIKTVTAYHDTDICAVSENSYNIDGTVSTCTNTLLHPYDGHNDSHTYTYDAAGRLLKETVSYDGGEPVAVQQLSYNAIGQLSANDLGAFTEAYTYNVRGAMTGRKSDVFEQTISFSNHFDRLYNGSIGMITDKLTGGKSTTSGYSYDNAGRLTSALIFLDGKTRPTGYTYDLNGNITALNRLGYNPPSLAERIDDLVYQYDGNKVRKITDKSPVVISEKTMNFVDGADEEIEYTYDRNGNMTWDANRGIAMFWDYNNRLEKVNFGFDKYLSFTRSATGRKLSMTNRTPAQRPSIGLGRPWIATTTVTHYYGAYEYRDGKFSRLNTATGYRDSLGVHVYVRDWQGNIRAVVRKGADGKTILEQATYYYPYGMPMAESTNPTINRYKYTGKELLTDHGVNIMDYGARFYDPTTCLWLSQDPLRTLKPGQSSYIFCSCDPINRTDPSGLADFWANGKLIGNDGIDDNRVLVMKTTNKKYIDKETVPGAGLDKKTAKEAIKFIKDNSDNAKKFENSFVYGCFIEVENSPEVRQSMVDIVSQDDGRGGSRDSNNREYGGYIENGTVISVKPGPKADPAQGESASIFIDGEHHSTFHSHPSGIGSATIDYDSNKLGQGGGNAINRPTQFPSSIDIGAAGNNTHYVFGRGDKKVYIYTKDGVQAEMKLKEFINLSK